MMKSYMALVLANQQTDNIRGLTKYRPIAAIPFAGRYRILDFALTNLTRAGITNIGLVVEPGKTRSIKDHTRGGQFWDLNRKDGGIFILPSTLRSDTRETNLDNFRSNIEYLHKSKEKHVIIYPAHLIGNIDMVEVIKNHEASGKDLTIAYKTEEKENISTGSTTIVKDENDEVKFGAAVNLENSADISLEIKIIKKETLLNLAMIAVQHGVSGDLNGFLEKNLDKVSTNFCEVKGYSRFVKTTIDYRDASEDMLKSEIRRELLLSNGGISTKINDTPPAHYEDTSVVDNSLIANGCRVKGTVRNSIVGRRVEVGEGAIIENSIIFQSCKIEAGAEIKNVIMDKYTEIEKFEVLKGSKEYPMVIEKKSFLDK